MSTYTQKLVSQIKANMAKTTQSGKTNTAPSGSTKTVTSGTKDTFQVAPQLLIIKGDDAGNAQRQANYDKQMEGFVSSGISNTPYSSGGTATKSTASTTSYASSTPSYTSPSYTQNSTVQQGSRYVQSTPSQGSIDAGIGNPVKKKKKFYDEFGNEIVNITDETGQQQGIPQVGSDAWLQEKQRQEAEQQVKSQLLEPLDRQMTMFDRGKEDLDINKQRSQEQLDLEKQRAEEDRKLMLEEARRNTQRNIEDTSKARAETMQQLEKQAAVMGINMVSTYQDTYKRTMDKFNTAINRLGEDLGTYEGKMGLANERLQADYDRSIKNMMQDYNINTTRLQDDFNYAVRDYKDYMIREANVMVEKYGLSSEKLGKSIQEISFNAFKAVNDAYSSYLGNLDAETELLDKQVNNVLNTRNNMLAYENNLVNQFVENSGNMTVNDLNAMVSRGEMSTQNAQNAISKVVDLAINTLDGVAIEGVGLMFQDQIVEGLNKGFTPNQILQNIIDSDEFKQVTQKIAENDPLFKYKLREAQLQNEKQSQDLKETDLDYRKGLQEYLNETKNILPTDAVELYGSTPAVRNFNPGNITDLSFGGYKVPGERFTRFDTPQEGFQALVDKVIFNQTNPQSKYYGKTLGEYFKIYAPSSDNNNPVRYAQNVASRLGVTIDTMISELDPYKFASEIARHEDGKSYKMLSDLGIINGQGLPGGGGTQGILGLAEYIVDTQSRGQGYSDSDTQAFTDSVKKYAERGEEKMIYQLFRNKIMDNKNVGPSIYDNQQLKNGLDLVKITLQQFKESGGSTNVLRSIAEKTANYLGTTTDEQLAKAKNQLGVLVADYIRSISGTAASDAEVQRLVGNLPSIKNIDSFNMSLIDNLGSIADTKMRTNIETYLGFYKDLGPKIFPEVYTNTTQQNTQQGTQQNVQQTNIDPRILSASGR